MPMNAVTLSAAILSAMKAKLGPAEDSTIQDDALTPLAEAIAEEVVAHIQTNATVSVTSTGLATGVTPGAAAVPVSSSGTGTIA